MIGRGDLVCASASRRLVMEAAVDQEPAFVACLVVCFSLNFSAEGQKTAVGALGQFAT